MKILLKGYYGFGNLGDDLLMKVVFDWLKRVFPSGTIDIFSNNKNSNKNISAEYIGSFLKENVEIVDWSHRCTYDLIIDGGGGVFFSDQNSGKFWLIMNKIFKYLGAEKCKKIDNFLRFVFNKPLNIKTQYRLGIGLGVEDFNPQSKYYFSYLVTLASFSKIYLRDNESLSRIRNLLNAEKIGGSYSDLVFRKDFDQSRPENKLIGIVLMDHHLFKDDFYSYYSKLSEKLNKKGFKVKYFSFDRNHDKSYIEKVPNVICWNPSSSLDLFLKEFSKCQLVVSYRAHGLILSSKLNIPSIAICFRPKLKQIAKLLEGACIPMDWPSSINDEVSMIDQITSGKVQLDMENACIKNEKLVVQMLGRVEGELNATFSTVR
ncbi:polysaccharide pyruvyl transferase family protein [Ekhidna sp.]